ncbi:MAG TPA: DUF1015 family protein [Chitinophagales bacterium]|nr:DUF1015 family protein [Chitinophagales bacterium]
MDIKPFKGYRPVPELAEKVTLIPNNLLNEPDRRRAARSNPYSFAHIVKPRLNFPDDIAKSDQQLFGFAKNYFEKLLAEGILIRDNSPCFYIYRMTMDNRSQTGLTCCMNIKDYNEGKIKKHEHTRSEKELENALQFELTRLNTNPVFLAYSPVTKIDELIASITAQKPDYDFISEYGVHENLWIVRDEKNIQSFIQLFEEKVSAVYIADGHHRAAAASIFSRKIHESNPIPARSKDYDYFLVSLFPADQLKIYDYNRVVRSLNGLDEKFFLKKAEEKFIVDEARRIPYDPRKPHRFGMYLNGKWYRLKAKERTYSSDPISILDVSILQNNLLEPILGIHDPRTDRNIDFIPGVKGLKELEKRVSKGKAAVAFSLYPVTMEQLMAVSDAGEVMPPKSTWFEPKLLSGLVTFRMEF